MIPAFNIEGNLPPGIHVTTFDLFSSRFGTSEHRRRLLTGLEAALVPFRSCRCQGLYVDGMNPGEENMIKNERQYRITKAQADKFAEALNSLRSRQSGDPLLMQLESDALESQLGELREELENYECLRSGETTSIIVESFEELPQALVKARIALGLSQKDLADRLGMKEQQIQRYESTNYQSASMSRLHDVIEALGVKVHLEFTYANDAKS